MTGTGAIDVASGTTGERPGSPSAGMFRFNSTTTEFEGYDGSNWGEIGGGGGATGGGTDEVFMENGHQINTDYQLASGKNAVSVGVITVINNRTVTIPSGRTWVVL